MLPENLLPALIGALVGGLVTTIGWFANYYFGRKKDTETRQREARLNYLKGQIEELYAPLWGLAEQSRIVHEVTRKRLPDRSKFTRQDNEIYMFFNERYFLPINAQISDLIRKKIYLLQDGELPASFNGYLEHQVLGESLYQLWKEKSIDSTKVEGKGYPPEFNDDVKAALDELRKQYFDEMAIASDMRMPKHKVRE